MSSSPYSLSFISFLIIFITYSTFIGHDGVLAQSSSLYDFDLSNIVSVGLTKVTQHKINFFPQKSGTPTYTYFPAPEYNTVYLNHTLIKDNSRFANDLNANDWSPPLDLTSSRSLLLIIPNGMTLISSSFTLTNVKYTFVVHGTLKTNPSENVDLSLYEMVIYPTGTLQVRPQNSSIKHSITLQASHFAFGNPSPVSPIILFDPYGCLSFLCLGCTIDIQGDTSTPSWIGVRGDSNTSTIPAQVSNSLSASGYKNGTPLLRLDKSVENSVNQASLSTITTSQTANYNPSSQTITIPSSRGGGYVNLYPNGKNVIISSTTKAPIVITGPANVNMQSVIFRGLGWTNNSQFDNTILNTSTNSYSYYGSNQDERYGITLLHVQKPVTINNCIFDDTGGSTRFMIGAKRSFGNITNNAFLLTTQQSSAIGFLYGTESFNIENNGFLSLWSQTSNTFDQWTPPVRTTPYPDIGCINCAVYSTSPYLGDLKNCFFEGGFLGGAVKLEPLQSRSQLTGVNVDVLLGKYDGQTQDNSDNYQTNAVWQPFLSNGIHDNLFTFYSDVKIDYSAQPSLVLRQSYSTFIRVQSTAPQGLQCNIHLIYQGCSFVSYIQDVPTSPSAISAIFKGSYEGLVLSNSTVDKLVQLFYNLNPGDIGYLGMNDVRMQGDIYPTDFVSSIPLSFYDDVTIASVQLAQRSPITTLYSPRPIIFETGTSNVTLNQTFLPTLTYSSFQFNRSIFLDGQLFLQKNGSNNSISSVVDDITFSSYSSTPGYHKVLATNNPNNAGNDGIYLSSKGYTSVYTTALIKSSYPSQFYLGISLTESTSPASLQGFNGRWTKCQLISEICQVDRGSFGSMLVNPTSMTNSSDGISTNDQDLLNILSSFYSTNSQEEASRLQIRLQPGEYTFFLYFVNPFSQGYPSSSVPFFQVKINGELQLGSSLINQIPPVGQFLTSSQYYFNQNDSSGSTLLTIEWGFTESKNISLSGIEIFSNLTEPYDIPVSDAAGPALTSYLFIYLLGICYYFI